MATAIESRSLPQVQFNECFIGGRWVPSSDGKTFPTINPASEDVIAEIAFGTAEDVDNAVRVARDAFEHGEWSRLSGGARGRLLYRLAELIEEHAEELAALETLDNGKPLRNSREVNLPLTVETFRYFAGYADKVYGQTIPVPGDYFSYSAASPWEWSGKSSRGTFPC